MSKNQSTKGSPIITLLIIAIFLFSGIFYIKTSHTEVYQSAINYLKELSKNNLQTVNAEVFNNFTDAKKMSSQSTIEFDYLSGYNSQKTCFPLKNATVTSDYGSRTDPVTKKSLAGHHGIDLVSKTDTDILCYANGTVTKTEYSAVYGNCITVEHGDISTFYAHLSKVLVTEGQSVEAGQSIGVVGSTGKSTGTHLHFSVIKDGNWQNPNEYIFKNL